MATLPKPRTVTYEEWVNMPETEGREEVVNGEIRPMPLPKSPHARVIRKLVTSFDRQVDAAQHELFSEGIGLIIRKSPLTCRAPDIVVFARTTEVEIDGYFHSAPILAIEVLSPYETRRQTSEKVADYEGIGVGEVWIVNPHGETVEVLLLEKGHLRRSTIVADGMLSPREIPQVQIDIARIWPD
jgi:Uma2 family endonuclease